MMMLSFAVRNVMLFTSPTAASNSKLLSLEQADLLNTRCPRAKTIGFALPSVISPCTSLPRGPSSAALAALIRR
jgi:hypothetical protein